MTSFFVCSAGEYLSTYLMRPEICIALTGSYAHMIRHYFTPVDHSVWNDHDIDAG